MGDFKGIANSFGLYKNILALIKDTYSDSREYRSEQYIVIIQESK